MWDTYTYFVLWTVLQENKEINRLLNNLKINQILIEIDMF